MASLQESLLGDDQSPPGPAGQEVQTNSGATRPSDADPSRRIPVEQWILDLHDNDTRENALQRLSKIREIREDLAPLLWYSFGTSFTLLKEIIEVYPLLSTPTLTQEASNRACNTLSLFQCIAAHPETRMPFINANMPLYVYPFLNTESKDKPHEYLRLSTLGVVGALVKDNDEDVIHFLLQTQAFYYCIRCMEVGTELSRTVATFIVERILMSDQGLRYCSSFADRFCVITHLLARMLADDPSHRLLKLILRCFLRLSEGPREGDSLNCCLPKALRDPKVINKLADDPLAMAWLRQLYRNVQAAEQQRRRQQQQQQPPAPQAAEFQGHLIKG